MSLIMKYAIQHLLWSLLHKVIIIGKKFVLSVLLTIKKTEVDVSVPAVSVGEVQKQS